jgi:hypothetical protein
MKNENNKCKSVKDPGNRQLKSQEYYRHQNC